MKHKTSTTPKNIGWKLYCNSQRCSFIDLMYLCIYISFYKTKTWISTKRSVWFLRPSSFQIKNMQSLDWPMIFMLHSQLPWVFHILLFANILLATIITVCRRRTKNSSSTIFFVFMKENNEHFFPRPSFWHNIVLLFDIIECSLH